MWRVVACAHPAGEFSKFEVALPHRCSRIDHTQGPKGVIFRIFEVLVSYNIAEACSCMTVAGRAIATECMSDAVVQVIGIHCCVRGGENTTPRHSTQGTAHCRDRFTMDAVP